MPEWPFSVGETTFAGIGGKEEDAPIPVIRGSRWNLGIGPQQALALIWKWVFAGAV